MLTLNLLRPFCLSLWSVGVYHQTCFNPQFEGIYVLCKCIYVLRIYVCFHLCVYMYVCMHTYTHACIYLKQSYNVFSLNEYMKEH